MEKGPIDAVLLPLLAVIVILLVVPALLTVGVPVNAPVAPLKLAHVG
jgi:hypothetical protein